MIKDFLNFQPLPLKFIQRWNDLFAKIKEYWDDYNRKIDALRYIRRGDMTLFPFTKANSLGTYYDSRDSIREIRQAITETPAFQRRPVAFDQSWKGKIDQITGGNSAIFLGPKLAKSFIIGNSPINGIDELGSNLDFEPLGSRLVQPALGNIMIDLGLTPTDDLLDELMLKLYPLKNIYMFVEVGVSVPYALGPFIIGSTDIGDINFVLGDTSGSSGFYFMPLRSL